MAVSRLPRLRIVTALLGALLVVSIVPLIALHFSLIRINRDALETSEKKYLKGSSITLAEAIDNSISNAQKDLVRIADGILLGKSVATTGNVDIDPFFSLSRTEVLDGYR